ncbi:MAG TPA: hypothetical protein VFE62_03055 [Gemmataceae bacterium]|nr:hypothetical protein [Gemmataceae bacterium]
MKQDDEQNKVKAFIRKHGVTKCPGFGDKKLAKLHVRRMKEYEEASLKRKAEMVRQGIIQ